MNLDALIEYAGRHAQFTEELYPELVGATEEERLAFIIRHSALHFAKTAGKIASISEAVDHGGEMDMEALRANVWKSFLNTLWLAKYAGVSGEQILAAIEKKYGEEIPRD